MRNCEICGFQERRSKDKVFFARFPLRQHICKQWVKVVGKEDLAYLPIPKLHQLRYVCGKHFEKRDFTKSKTRLKKNAVPKLELSNPPLSDEILKGFPLQMAESDRALATEGVAPVLRDLTNQIGDEVHQPKQRRTVQAFRRKLIDDAALPAEGVAPVVMDLTNQIGDEVHQPKQRRTVQALIDDADPSPQNIGACLPAHSVNQAAKGTKIKLPNDFTGKSELQLN